MAISQGFNSRSGSSGYSFAAFSRKRAANHCAEARTKSSFSPENPTWHRVQNGG